MKESHPTNGNHLTSLDLSGRTALITGGSRGLGLAIAQTFVAAGSNVILVARDRTRLAEAQATCFADRSRVTTYAADISSAQDIAALSKELNHLGQSIDILVNNAGTSTRGPFEEQTDEMWQDDLNLKLFAAIRLARFVLPGMKSRQWGRILNIVSINGKTPGAEGAPTCVSRAAGIALTKVMATEYARHNILVNALCTGVIMSDQIVRRHLKNGKGMPFDEYVKLEGQPIPIGRVGTAQEYANVALFLASNLSSYVTGTAINIDGGLCKVV